MNTRVLLSHRARRVFIILHLWLGLIIGLWFSLVGLSGSVLAWRGELSALELRAKFPLEKSNDGAPMISLSDAIAIGTKSRGEQALTVTIPHSRTPFYSVVQGRPKRGQISLIDPYSGRVHPNVNARETITGTIQQWHQRLIAGPRGYVTNGFFNMLAIPLVLSGLWLWWPSNIAQLKARVQVKRGASLKRKLYDLHNVMGIYLYAILFITTVTGAMLVYQHIAADGGLSAFLNQEAAQPTAKSAAPKAARGGENEAPEVKIGSQRLASEEILQAARALRPHYELSRLQLPARTNQAIAATFQKSFGLTNSETVFLDPYNGQIVNAPEKDAAFNVRGWTRLLHLGEFGGVLSKLIYTLTGLVPTGLFITGARMWWNKKRKKLGAKNV